MEPSKKHVFYLGLRNKTKTKPNVFRMGKEKAIRNSRKSENLHKKFNKPEARKEWRDGRVCVASEDCGLLIKCGAALEMSRCKRAVTFVFVSLHLFFPAVLCALGSLETAHCFHRQVYHILSLDGIHSSR